jgi:transposase
MDKITRIIELKKAGNSIKKISKTLGVSKNTVRKYLRRNDREDIDVESDNKDNLSKLLLGQNNQEERARENRLNELLPYLVKELKRVGVTRYLLWQEYKITDPDGYSYSRFCARIKSHKGAQDVTLRLEHKNGYALTIDYAGKKLHYVNKSTGEVHYCEVLVCTLPASGYTYACALPSQKQEDFVEGINQALLYLGGLPKVILSDNLKIFVIKSDRYEPTFNALSLQLATHYGIELQATRSGKPKDKAHVERHIAIAYNKIYGPLRDEEYHSIKALNQAIHKQLEELNNTNYQGKDYSRKDMFVIEKEDLYKLPSSLFQVKKSTRAKVQRNYHVVLGEDKHQYSVPYRYVGKQSEIVYTRDTVEVYIDNIRIGIHKRDRRPHGYSTAAIHMPEKHVKYLEQKGWDAAYFKKQAEQIGSNTLWAISTMLDSKSLIEQTYNACLGVLGLGKKYTKERLEKACSKAHTTHRVNYQILSNILKNNMDKIETPVQARLFRIQDHNNIRGADEYG